MANYNAYFPQTYAPYTYGTQSSVGQNYAAPAQMNGAITWVQGEAGARSINVLAGQTALLMDSETNVFYIKSSDASGIPLPLRTFKYEEVVVDGGNAQAQVIKDAPAPTTYITKEELDARLAEFAIELKKEDNSNGQFDL